MEDKRMIQTIEAVVDANDQVRLLGEFQFAGLRRAFVMVLEETANLPNETSLLAEASLSDWSRPEEDAAWASLQ